MKYTLLILSLLSSFLLPLGVIFAVNPDTCNFTGASNAQEFIAGCATGTQAIGVDSTTETKQSIQDRVKTIAKSAISLGALLAVGALVWAGIQYTKAYGEDESLKKAKTTGIYALIGLFLLLASFGLVNIFINFIYQVTSS